MSEAIEQALINCIGANCLIEHHECKSVKVALIGERNKGQRKCTLRYKLAERFNLKGVTVFTASDKFTVKGGKRFDILIGCRPCDAEKLILEAATKYNKRFVLMPCTCNSLRTKIVKYIREYPVITHIDSYSEDYGGGKYDRMAWMILFNKGE